MLGCEMDQELYDRTLEQLKLDYVEIEREYKAAADKMMGCVNAICGLSVMLGRPSEEQYDHPDRKKAR